jgi:hypothetical protein
MSKETQSASAVLESDNQVSQNSANEAQPSIDVSHTATGLLRWCLYWPGSKPVAVWLQTMYTLILMSRI